MSALGWIIVLVVVIPLLGVAAWFIVIESLVRVPSGSLGLLMVKGRATDTALLPGTHFIPALRRRMVEEYPSVEQAYRAGASDDLPERTEDLRERKLNRSGPSLTVVLGDRTTATISYAVRFRLVPEQLRDVHERFGPHGIFGIVADESSRIIANTLGDPEIGIESFFGPAREGCQERLRAAIGGALGVQGIMVTGFLLGSVDFGQTGEVIQATVRARYERDREQAEAATRMARALNDADLQQHMTSSSDAAWRYRETDLWRDLVRRTEALQVALRTEAAAAPRGAGTQAESGLLEQSIPVNPS